MKKTGINKFAAFLFVGLSVLLMGRLFAQASTIVKKTAQQLELESIKNATGLKAAFNEGIPEINLLAKADFTSGTTTVIFWQPLEELVKIWPYGDTLSVSRNKCAILVWADEDSINIRTPRIVSGNTVTMTFDWAESSQVNIDSGPIYYWARLSVTDPNNSNATLVSSKRKVIFSQQDTTKPVVAKVTPEDSNGNFPPSGWFGAQNDAQLKYTGLSDPSGISSAFISGDFGKIEQSLIDIDTLKGEPGPGTVGGSFPNLNTFGSGRHSVTLGACDAAYSDTSHAAGAGIPAVWTLAGNCDSLLDSAVINIDLDAPTWDLVTIDSLYTSDSLSADGKIWLQTFVNDTLSGVDADSITVSIQNSQTLTIDDVSITGGNADGASAEIEFSLSDIPDTGINETITLSFHAKDRAGNPGDTIKNIHVLIDPAYFTFKLFDLSTGTIRMTKSSVGILWKKALKKMRLKGLSFRAMSGNQNGLRARKRG